MRTTLAKDVTPFGPLLWQAEADTEVTLSASPTEKLIEEFVYIKLPQDNMPTCDIHKFLNRTDSTPRQSKTLNKIQTQAITNQPNIPIGKAYSERPTTI